MNYKKHYNLLIEKSKNRNLNTYKEKHHIIPRCMGGSDDKENLVELTAREHFIAHILLVKIYPEEHGLIKAVQMMCIGHNKKRTTNRMYGWLKEKFSKEQSRNQSGKGNSQYGKIWIYNLETFESKKIHRNDIIPIGWTKGRKLKPKDYFIYKEKDKKHKKEILKQNKEKDNRNLVLEILKDFVCSDTKSISEYAKSIGKHDNSLHNMFRKYLPERTWLFKSGQKPNKEIIKKFLENIKI